ncbi:MAG: iron-containing alcohol dehydrogenase [Agathobaculum sp.]|jgi:alcohol dehydrogenase YqhD (iron-dependent ADH family)|uniref:iron-containing alcohol dehydrogenase n=1 Tax=Agathobaculum sp. TaxID=2048138 RepID=UPI003D941905
MQNFTLHTTTEVVFGRDIEKNVGPKLKELGASRVLVHFGGGSVKRNGLLDKVEQSLTDAGLSYIELGGVSPNPKLSLVREGIALAEKENVDFILAVGGGSVLDSAKGIGMGVATGRDPWEFASTGTAPDKTLPVASVLTLAASGSETSNSCVLTNEENMEKRGITSQTNRPCVSFLNPENTYTVSKFQTGCGIVDIMMHTLERYLTPGDGSDITDRLAEGLLIAVRDAGRVAIENPCDYEARATLMWAGSVSHNGYTGCGRASTFPVHKLEHELSAFHDEIAHGAGLSVLFPAWALYVMEHDIPRFAQLANRVFGVEMDFVHPERTAREGILTMKRFFAEIGMPVRMEQLGLKPEDYETLANNAVKTVRGPVKSYVPLDEQAIVSIFKLAE